MRKLFVLTPYFELFQRWRATAFYTGAAVFMASRLLLFWPTALGQTALITGLIGVVAVIAAWGLARRGDLRSAAAILVIVMTLESAVYLLGESWQSPRGWVELCAAVVLGGLLLDDRGSIATAVYALAVIVLVAVLRWGDLSSGGRHEWLAVYLALALGVLALAVPTVLVVYGGRLVAQGDQTQGISSRLIGMSAEIARGFFERSELDAFLKYITEAIPRHFEFIYYAQVFLIEPGSQQAMLCAGTGPVGEQLVSQEYGLDVGGLSAVGRVTLSGAPLLVADSTRDAIHKPHPLLPQTRSELAIPLVGSEHQVIGALDIQSIKANAFKSEDVVLLQTVAEQLAVAIDGLQLYESAQRNIRENQALFQQTQASIREIERLNYQLTGRAWNDYLQLQPDSSALTLDLETGQAMTDADWTDALQQAAESQQVLTTTRDGRQVVALPIAVRNEVIGAMEFELEPGAELLPGAVELIAAVGQRLGMAMENRRLFDETQRVAQREALINDIGAQLQVATGVDAIIQQAARHLQESLKAHQVTIRLGAVPTGESVQEKPQK